MNRKVLLSAPYMLPEIERFRNLLEGSGIELCVPEVAERLEEDDLIPLVGAVDGVICGDDRFTARVLDAAPRLKVISKWGTGIDSIDLDACRCKNIAVFNTPGAFTDPVADSVMAYLLNFARMTSWLDREMKLGRWEKLPGRALCECTLGVIGVGNIGKAVAHRAAAFGMRLLGHDVVSLSRDFLDRSGITMVTKEKLLQEADFVTLHCDLNRSSRHLMDQKAFSLMKPDAFLINTSRGAVVDEAALVNTLRQGGIAGAALDVFEEEPLPVESPLRSMDNVLLAPHNANSSPSAWERVHENTVRNLLNGLKAGEQ